MKRCAVQKGAIAAGRSLLFSEKCSAIVAIPARNEADRVARCLSALAVQRDNFGAPVPPGEFGVLLLVNNSDDGTAEAARQLAVMVPYPLEILELQLFENATAGGARRRAMQEASDRLKRGEGQSILLTTDADSVVTPTWFANNVLHLKAGADCVAGYIDAEPVEIVSLGSGFLARGRLEDIYLRLIAEIDARCDPRPHDPWPNHRVSSGASLAVTLAAYDAVGGMPDKALGEDVAFTALLDDRGFKVRHALDVAVVTSCRVDGRAAGGAAETMRRRRDIPDSPCDAELEPALAAMRRAAYRGYLRQSFRDSTVSKAVERLFGPSGSCVTSFASFEALWSEVEHGHPKLRRGAALRPSDLPRQIAAAEFILRHLQAGPAGATGDKRHRAATHVVAGAQR